MAITVGPNIAGAFPTIGAAGYVAGRGDYERFKRQEDRADAELSQRERLEKLRLAEASKSQIRSIAAEEALQNARFAENERSQKFDLEGRKELFGLQTEENQKAREFDFGAQRTLQGDRLAFSQQELEARQMMEWYRLQQQGQLAAMDAQLRQQQLAAELNFRAQSQMFGAQTDFAKMGYQNQLNQQNAATNFGYESDLIDKRSQASMALQQGLYDYQTAQQTAKTLSQIQAVENARGKSLTNAQADAMIMQLETGLKIPQSPVTNAPSTLNIPGTQNPYTDPNTGQPILFNVDPQTGAYTPIQMPQGQPPVDPLKLIDAATKIQQAAGVNATTGAPNMDFATALEHARTASQGGQVPYSNPYNDPNFQPAEAERPLPTSMPVVLNEADYAALPSGQNIQYIDANGNVRVKP